MSVVRPTTTAPVQSRRAARPERITIGGKVFVRNDKVADKYKTTERSINRGDADGAPYILLHGVKYRPEEQYDQYVVAQVVVRGQPPVRRRRSSHHR